MPARDIVCVGASAGGLTALRTLLGELPSDLPAAVLVVMHMSAHAESRLVESLLTHSMLPVRRARDGEALEHGVVLVAVRDRHLVLTPAGVRLTRGPRECRSRPAIDVLFRSAAVAFGPRVVGAVLTGLLDDGTAGLWAIKDHGGIALVQDPETAEHPSMPRSAIEAVEVDRVGSLEELAGEIVRHVGAAVPEAHAALSPRHEIETGIALEHNGLRSGALDLGPPSVFTCPTCHGALAQIDEGSLTRYRCHTGHAYSPRTLLADIDHEIEIGLADSLRSVEERILLLRQMAQIAASSGNASLGARYEALADDADKRLRPIEALLRDGGLTRSEEDG